MIYLLTLCTAVCLTTTSMVCLFKSCVRYIFASLFFKSRQKHLSNYEKCFLFNFKSSFRSRENQILEFPIFRFHDVIKCLSIKQEIFYWITWEVNTVCYETWPVYVIFISRYNFIKKLNKKFGLKTSSRSFCVSKE